MPTLGASVAYRSTAPNVLRAAAKYRQDKEQFEKDCAEFETEAAEMFGLEPGQVKALANWTGPDRQVFGVLVPAHLDPETPPLWRITREGNRVTGEHGEPMIKFVPRKRTDAEKELSDRVFSVRLKLDWKAIGVTDVFLGATPNGGHVFASWHLRDFGDTVFLVSGAKPESERETPGEGFELVRNSVFLAAEEEFEADHAA